MYLGDFKEDGDIFFKFTTRAFATGIPTTLAGSPVLSVYKDEGGAATEKTTSETYFDLDVDHDSIAGWHNVRIDLSGDAFFATGADYAVVITVGTVDSVNVFGENLATFSIENRSMGQPVGATLSDDIAAIKAETVLIVADTNELQTDNVPGLIATAQSDLDTITGAAGAIIDSAAATVTVISDAVWDEDATGHQTGGTFGQAIGDPAANTETIYDAVVTDAAGTNVAVDIVAVKSDTATILTDTADMQPKLGSPAGASISADLVIIDNFVDALETRVPVVLNTTASGNIGIDWANVENKTSTVDLSDTTTKLVDTVTAVTNEVTADITKIGGSATAADKLEEGAEALAIGTVNDASATTTAFKIALTGDTVVVPPS